MASTASTSSSSSSTINTPSTSMEEIRPQAGPLPRKRGEIGFRESLVQEDSQESVSAETESPARPVRHPADREPPTSTAAAAPPATSPRPSDSSSTHKAPKHGFLAALGLYSKVGGIDVITYLRFLLQLLLIGATLAGWVITTQHLSQDNTTSPDDGTSDSSDSSDSTSSALPIAGSGGIFVHVAFAIAVLGQLLFLERCVFYMRAQRYAHQHPGETLPTHGRSLVAGGPRGMGFAPWNRPSLPTYAATLAQSGLGTGDVEDNQIAIPPPPAYGNTRGSTLLLSNFLRNSLRRSQATTAEGDARRMSQMSRQDRPVSYMSHDSAWEERCDAERALKLAETLAQLEEGTNVTEPLPVHVGVAR